MQNYNLENEAVVDNSLLNLFGGMQAFKGTKAIGSYLPYAKDIWKGRNLLFHKPFDKMSQDEFLNYQKQGLDYYQNYLQKNPANVEEYGQISFGKHNRGKDFTKNMELYPLLRKKLENSKPYKSTNTKNELDRNYDYFSAKHKGNLYDLLIENIEDAGKRYKMTKIKIKEDSPHKGR